VLASSQSWLPLLRPSIPLGWRLRLLGENFPLTGSSETGSYVRGFTSAANPEI